jgi:hypothetical protein
MGLGKAGGACGSERNKVSFNSSSRSLPLKLSMKVDPLAHNGQAVTVPPADRELIFRITLPNVSNLIPLAF